MPKYSIVIIFLHSSPALKSAGNLIPVRQVHYSMLLLSPLPKYILFTLKTQGRTDCNVELTHVNHPQNTYSGQSDAFSKGKE